MAESYGGRKIYTDATGTKRFSDDNTKVTQLQQPVNTQTAVDVTNSNTQSQNLKSQGLSPEQIDAKYQNLYGQGMPGEVYDKIKSDPSFAAKFNGYLDQGRDALRATTGDERDILGKLGLLTQKEIEDSKIAEAQNKLQTRGDTFVNDITAERTKRLSDLSGLLDKMRGEAFATNQPTILEDLSGRGLLHSSDVGTQLAKEQSRLSTISENTLRSQALADLDYTQNLRSGLEDKIMGLDLSGLEREFSLTDWARDADLSKQLAKTEADAAKSSAQDQMLGNILGTGLAITSKLI